MDECIYRSLDVSLVNCMRDVYSIVAFMVNWMRDGQLELMSWLGVYTIHGPWTHPWSTPDIHGPLKEIWSIGDWTAMVPCIPTGRGLMVHWTHLMSTLHTGTLHAWHECMHGMTWMHACMHSWTLWRRAWTIAYIQLGVLENFQLPLVEFYANIRFQFLPVVRRSTAWECWKHACPLEYTTIHTWSLHGYRGALTITACLYAVVNSCSCIHAAWNACSKTWSQNNSQFRIVWGSDWYSKFIKI